MNNVPQGSIDLSKFSDVEVRAFEVEGVIWYVAKDCALKLAYKDTVNAIKYHCKNSIAVQDLSRGGQTPPLPLQPQTKLINKSDVLRLITGSSTTQCTGNRKVDI